MAKQALEIIKAEHRSVAAVLDAASYLIAEIRAGRLQPDFRLLWAMLAYFEQFPEGLHHPKEDDFLFDRLHKRTHEADALLAELETQHENGQERVRALQDAPRRYEGNPDGAFDEFVSAVETFAQFNWRPMSKVENELMPLADTFPMRIGKKSRRRSETIRPDVRHGARRALPRALSQDRQPGAASDWAGRLKSGRQSCPN